VSESGSVRRRRAEVLVAAPPNPRCSRGFAWCSTRPGRFSERAALAALAEAPADLVSVDREPGGLDAPGVGRTLLAEPQLDDAWRMANR
jgi:hypothetical protein